MDAQQDGGANSGTAVAAPPQGQQRKRADRRAKTINDLRTYVNLLEKEKEAGGEVSGSFLA